MKRAADIVREHFQSHPPELGRVVAMVAAAQRDAIASTASQYLQIALKASLAKRSVSLIDASYSAGFNAALDMIERDVAAFLESE